MNQFPVGAAILRVGDLSVEGSQDVCSWPLVKTIKEEDRVLSFEVKTNGEDFVFPFSLYGEDVKTTVSGEDQGRTSSEHDFIMI